MFSVLSLIYDLQLYVIEHTWMRGHNPELFSIFQLHFNWMAQTGCQCLISPIFRRVSIIIITWWHDFPVPLILLARVDNKYQVCFKSHFSWNVFIVTLFKLTMSCIKVFYNWNKASTNIFHPIKLYSTYFVPL